MHIALFLAGDAHENTNLKEMATDGYKFASFVVCLQREAEAKGIQGRLCGECKQAIAKNA
jgi:hypothetical protein